MPRAGANLYKRFIQGIANVLGFFVTIIAFGIVYSFLVKKITHLHFKKILK